MRHTSAKLDESTKGSTWETMSERPAAFELPRLRTAEQWPRERAQRAQRAERRTAPHSIIINSPSRRRPAATKRRRHATGSVTPRSYSYASWLRIAHSVPTPRLRSLWQAKQACRRGVCVGVRTLAHSSKKAARLSVLQGGRGYISRRLRLRLVCLEAR